MDWTVVIIILVLALSACLDAVEVQYLENAKRMVVQKSMTIGIQVVTKNMNREWRCCVNSCG